MNGLRAEAAADSDDDWMKRYADLVRRLEDSPRRPKSGLCGMTVDACLRHSVYLVDGSIIQDAQDVLEDCPCSNPK